MTKKYELPFCIFVGVNYHDQSILLYCALLSHENSETYEWLFSTWVSCMGRKAPDDILIDQCAAMLKALLMSMPDYRHRWCLCHITDKFCSKLGVYKGYDKFKDELLNFIYDSLDPEEFEESWSSVIVKYKLSENEWLACNNNKLFVEILLICCNCLSMYVQFSDICVWHINKFIVI